MKENNSPHTILRKLKGVVVSDKMDKTIVVKVEKVKIHPKYQKRYRTSKKYKVHDEKNRYKVGDIVAFAAIRPVSKNKCWRAL